MHHFMFGGETCVGRGYLRSNMHFAIQSPRVNPRLGTCQ